MKNKQTATIKLPIISNPYGIACFEDFIAEATRLFNEEKDLKNAAFSYLVSKGLYNDFNNQLHSGNLTTEPMAIMTVYAGKEVCHDD